MVPVFLGCFALAAVERGLEEQPDPLGEHARRGGGGNLALHDADRVFGAARPVAAEVALLLAQGPQPLHGPKVSPEPDR